VASVFVNYTEEALFVRVAVDHALGLTPDDPKVCLYLNEDGMDKVCLEMTRLQFTDLCALMREAVATGLPASLRFGQVQPPFLLDPYRGTKTLLSEVAQGAEVRL
jgi:hypothetical protein